MKRTRERGGVNLLRYPQGILPFLLCVGRGGGGRSELAGRVGSAAEDQVDWTELPPSLAYTFKFRF